MGMVWFKLLANRWPNGYRVLKLVFAIGVVQLSLVGMSLANNSKSVADTYVREGGAQYANYGGNSTLLLMNQDVNNHTEAYMRFSVSQIADKNVLGAHVWFYVEEIHGSGKPTVGVYVVNNLNGWTETSLTWANRSGSPIKIGEVKVNATGWQLVTVNTSQIQTQLNKNQANMTIVLKVESGNQVLYISSKEHMNGAKHPTLSIATPSSKASPYLYSNADPTEGQSATINTNYSGVTTIARTSDTKVFTEVAPNVVLSAEETTCSSACEFCIDGQCGVNIGGVTVEITNDNPPSLPPPLPPIPYEPPTNDPDDSLSGITVTPEPGIPIAVLMLARVASLRFGISLLPVFLTKNLQFFMRDIANARNGLLGQKTFSMGAGNLHRLILKFDDAGNVIKSYFLNINTAKQTNLSPRMIELVFEAIIDLMSGPGGMQQEDN